MKLDFERIIRKLEAKASMISMDNDRIKKLINETKAKVQKNKTLMEIWDDIKLFIDLIKDWMKGNYKEISNGSIVMIIISLLYLVNPLDIVPDFLLIGFVDDLAVIAYVIKKISSELEIYKEWKYKDIDKEIFETEAESVEDIQDLKDEEKEDDI